MNMFERKCSASVLQLFLASDITTSPGSLLLGLFRKQMAVVNHALLDQFILDNFLVHVFQELDLFTDELLNTASVESTSSPLLVPQVSVDSTETVFEHLKPVFGESEVQFAEVRSWTDGSENSVILDRRRAGSERSHHADSFRGSQRAKSLMLNVPSLENNSRSLEPSESISLTYNQG